MELHRMKMSLSCMDFNNALVSSNEFICKHCESILTCPIYLLEDGSNICLKCYNGLRENGVSPWVSENKLLASLLNKLYFSCIFESEGCTEKIQCSKLNSHQDTCMFRSVNCVFCPWKNKKTEFIAHLVENHEEEKVASSSDLFEIITNTKDVDVTKILNTSVGTFIMRISSVDKNKLYYCIYDSTEIERDDYEFKLKIGGSNPYYLKTPCKIVYRLDSFISFNRNEVTEVDLNTLKQHLQLNGLIKHVIKISLKDKHLIMENNLLKNLECPRCNLLMKPPIFQCIAGHSICQKCKMKTNLCPICDEVLESTRNYSLEALTGVIRYPCTFKGCLTKFFLKDNHKTICVFKTYHCFIKKCLFKSSHVNLIEHLINVHPKHVYKSVDKILMETAFPPVGGITQRMCIINYNLIFKLTSQQTADSIVWGVVVLGPQQMENFEYNFEIGIFKTNELENSLIKRGSCKETMTFLSINNDILSEFLDNASLKYYFKIIKNIKI